MVVKRLVAEQLLAEGWKRQSVTGEPRLSEAVELYQSLDLEVLLVPVHQESDGAGSGGGCTKCFTSDEAPGRYQVIYTRPRGSGKDRA